MSGLSPLTRQLQVGPAGRLRIQPSIRRAVWAAACRGVGVGALAAAAGTLISLIYHQGAAHCGAGQGAGGVTGTRLHSQGLPLPGAGLAPGWLPSGQGLGGY